MYHDQSDSHMNCSVSKITVLIPAFNPDHHLLQLIDDLIDSNFNSIVVINDGSVLACAPVFEAIEMKKQCRLLRHAANLGKGRALKTGINYSLAHIQGLNGIVTCDADGQHMAEDVVKVSMVLNNNPECLVLGVREFCATVPLLSRLGNVITRSIFYILTGKCLSDTQTGLRGIPTRFIPTLISLEGEGYEYEMGMLIASKTQGIRVLEEKITTIYLNNNRSSHFKPVLDSIRIYLLLLRFAFTPILAGFSGLFSLNFIGIRNNEAEDATKK